MRVFRIFWNTLRGRQTSVIEKFLGQRKLRYLARLKQIGGRGGAASAR